MVGCRFADCGRAWEVAPVIHSVARGGPECRAVLGGSINLTAVQLEVEKEARHRSELARACTSRPRERESGVSWPWSCSLRQLVAVVVVVDVRLVLEAADLAVPDATSTSEVPIRCPARRVRGKLRVTALAGFS